MQTGKELLVGLVLVAGISCIYFQRTFAIDVEESTPLHSLTDEKLAGKCTKVVEINTIISEAISIGAPTYNSGNHAGCYTIYEGASYKILYRYGDKCKDTSRILMEALEKSQKDISYTEKAWTMRKAFDYILGVPTQTK